MSAYLSTLALLGLLMAEPASSPSVSEQALVQITKRALQPIVPVDTLPVGQGLAMEAGLVLAVSPERIQLFDRTIASLPAGGTCDQACADRVFAELRRMWMELALESTKLGGEIATRVHLAAPGDFPAASLIGIAYAVAQSRPTAPPDLTLLVNLPGRGVRAQRFHLLPPEGLNLQPGTGVLAPVVEIRPDGYTVDSLDSQFVRMSAADLPALQGIFAKMKKKYPGKEVLILRPKEGVSLQQVLQVVDGARTDFPTVVLAPA